MAKKITSRNNHLTLDSVTVCIIIANLLKIKCGRIAEALVTKKAPVSIALTH
ncbi:hypothetical protein WTH01_13740 [Weissella thailandensis]|nr:hypothetical protein WTH01_13740 [Weissella thailandensis]